MEEGADRNQIEEDIKTMPNYFADYDTEVHFVTEEELRKNHSGMPHGGLVIRYGKTGINNEHSHTIEYKIDLDSNPDFTASVLIAYARAAYRLNKEGVSGAKTVVDIAPAYLSSKSPEEIRKTII
jgi:diaminopimelate dehydrogenase